MKRADWLANNLKKTLGAAHRVSKMPAKPFTKARDFNFETGIAADTENGWLEDRPALSRDDVRREAYRLQEAEAEMRRRRMANELARSNQLRTGNANDVSTAEWRERYLQNMQNANGPFDRATRQNEAENETANTVDFSIQPLNSGLSNIARAMRGRTSL